MFNLDNFDLDIGEEFSSNIFSKEVNFGSKNELKIDKDWEKNAFNESTSSQGIAESSNKQFHHKTNSDSRSNSNNFIDFSFVKGSRENSLKRSCAQDEKPPKKRLSNEGLLHRKFPGPAGLLPDKPFREISDLALLTDKATDENVDEKEKEKQIVFSQNSGSVFLEPNYQKLVSDFNLNDSDNPLNRYTVEWVKKTALSKGFQKRKIPFLGLVVHSVHQGMTDSVLVLRDPTGEIHGSLHREVWTDMGGKLRAGIALALRQVGVLITGVIRRQIYLNITMNNILSVYGPSENENLVQITIVNKTSKLELMKSFEEWLAQPSRSITEKSSLSSPLFTTANDITFPSNNKNEIRNIKNKLEQLIDRSKEKKSNSERRNTEEVLADLDIMLTENDFKEEMTVPEMDSTQSQLNLFENEKGFASKRSSSQMLSPAESLIFEEVLSGINLDEFET